jgi:KUP system potassium uptake protein
LYFGSSGALGAAYGIAVTGTMGITSLLFHRVMVDRWHWSATRATIITGAFLTLDLAFFGSNVIKIAQGGWVPLAIGLALFVLMTTWKRGREDLIATLKRQSLPLDLFLEDIGRSKPYRVRGTAVFMTSESAGVPVVLLHHLKHNKVLHEKVVLLSIVSADVPEVPASDNKIHVEVMGEGFYRVVARYGFMESPDVKYIMGACALQGLLTKPAEISYILGRERLLPTGPSTMWRWRKKLFAIMSRNARSAAEFFGIPPNRVVELGAQIEL